MNKKVFPGLAVFFLFLALAGCVGSDLKSLDPLRTNTLAPGSPSSAYVAGQAPAFLSFGSLKGDSLSYQEGRPDENLPALLQGKPLELTDCVRVALELSPELRSSWRTVREAAARVGEEKSAFLPSADILATAAQQKQVSSQNIQAGQRVEPGNLFEGALGVNYLLFDGGQRSARVSGALADLAASGFQHNAALQDLVLRVEQAYYILLATKWARKVSEDTVDNSEYHVRLAKARFDAGLVPPSDVLKAETEHADANLALVIARNAVRVAEGTLASAMGLKVSATVNIADIPESDHPQEEEDMERLIEEAARNRPELLAALAKVNSKEASRKEARTQYWPRISANASYGGVDDTLWPQNDEWSGGLNLTWPMFTGFKRAYQVERAREETEQAKADYTTRLKGVELEVWTTYSKLTEASEAIQAARAFVASAAESERLASGEYKAGTGDIIALIDAQTALTSARNRLVQARFSWYSARAKFQQAVGRKLFDEAIITGVEDPRSKLRRISHMSGRNPILKIGGLTPQQAARNAPAGHVQGDGRPRLED